MSTFSFRAQNSLMLTFCLSVFLALSQPPQQCLPTSSPGSRSPATSRVNSPNFTAKVKGLHSRTFLLRHDEN